MKLGILSPYGRVLSTHHSSKQHLRRNESFEKAQISESRYRKQEISSHRLIQR